MDTKDHTHLTPLIEAILFIESEGVQYTQLKKQLSVDLHTVKQCLKQLAEKFDGGIQLICADTHCYFTTSDRVQQALKGIYTEQPVRFSASSLETLAIIAYTQPVTKTTLEQIRGVSCSYLLRKLLLDGYICKVGRKDVPGRPILFGTTQKFLMRFSLASLDDLPLLEQKETNLLSHNPGDD